MPHGGPRPSFRSGRCRRCNATNAPWSVSDKHIYEDVDVPLQQSTNRGVLNGSELHRRTHLFGNLGRTYATLGSNPQTSIQPEVLSSPPTPLPKAHLTSSSSSSCYDYVKALRQDGKSVNVSVVPFIVYRISVVAHQCVLCPEMS